MVHANNLKRNCWKEDSSRQSFELEVLLDGKYFYLYHLEIDFIGIVREELSYKGQYLQEYQQVMSAAG